MGYFEKIGNSLIFRDNGETVMVTPWGENGLRVRAVILNDISDECAALLEPSASEGEILLEENFASIQNGKICAEFVIGGGVYVPQITFKNRKGKILLQEISGGGALDRKARYFRPLEGGTFSLKAGFLPVPGEKIYGMGQYQQEIMDLKGCVLELAQRNSQASVPFYISSAGYGFLWNNPAVGQVTFGSNMTQWIAEVTKQLDYWITAGDTPAEIEEDYADVTGKVPMMPEYGLGYWQCKLRYFSQEQVLSVAREYKKRGIPLDVLVIDYFHWPKCGDWYFDEDFFPDPEAMVKELHDMGIETMVSVWPTVDVDSENYQEMMQKGLLVKNNFGVNIQKIFMGYNSFADATNPRTRKYVWDKLKKNYADIGIRTFWLDEAEPTYSNSSFELYRYHAGTALETGNIFPKEYSRMIYEGQRANGQEEIVNLVRCAWAGSQRYGALVWSGDIHSTYEDFRKQICAGIHMGIAGIPWWTTDIGGFSGGHTEDPEFQKLLIRWFQFGSFCPVMRMHGSRQPRENVIDKEGNVRRATGAGNEVWSFGEENYKILVKFIEIREMMRDYSRSLMKQAHEKGTPVMRALFYEFPEDEVCWDVKDSYLYGPDILVAPICYEKADSRKVYLPKGVSWTHAGTGIVYNGGNVYEIAASISTIPIFLREGRQEYLIGKI